MGWRWLIADIKAVCEDAIVRDCPKFTGVDAVDILKLLATLDQSRSEDSEELKSASMRVVEEQKKYESLRSQLDQSVAVIERQEKLLKQHEAVAYSLRQALTEIESLRSKLAHIVAVQKEADAKIVEASAFDEDSGRAIYCQFGCERKHATAIRGSL